MVLVCRFSAVNEYGLSSVVYCLCFKFYGSGCQTIESQDHNYQWPVRTLWLMSVAYNLNIYWIWDCI